MILESAQMLCTVVHKSGGTAPYRPVHQKHPCTLWVGESLSNWRWLKELARELNEEYKYRYRRDINHKSWDVVASLDEPDIPDIGLTAFAQAMPEEFKSKDGVEAYRKYYLGAKVRFATWDKRRPAPEWWNRKDPFYMDDDASESEDTQSSDNQTQRKNSVKRQPRRRALAKKPVKKQVKKEETIGVLTRRQRAALEGNKRA